MTQEQKAKILEMRINHYTIYEIAEKLVILPQSVHSFLKKIPVQVNPQVTYRIPKSITNDKINEIIERFLEDKSFEQIAEETQTPLTDVEALFMFIKSRLNRRVDSESYPEVAKYITDNNLTLKDFSEAIGMNTKSFSNILAGRSSRKIPPDIVKKISSVTGLEEHKITPTVLR